MLRKAAFALLLAVSFSALIAAQTAPSTQSKVNIIIDREAIRFAPQETVQELRLVVTDQGGTELYDSGVLAVTALDWTMRDSKGEAVKGGLYLYTLTIKDAAGATSERHGYLIINRTGDTDRVYVATGDKVGIGAGDKVSQVTVVGNADATVGSAELPSRASLTEANGERSGVQRDAASRRIAVGAEGAEPAQPAQKNSAGGGLGSPVKTNIPDDLVVNGNLIFTPAGARDITMQNNSGGLRFFGAPTLTTSPAAAAIQFWGNASGFPGQLYLDAGAHNSGALIFRTAPTGGTIAERMRVAATGNVGIGTNAPAPAHKLDVAGTINATTQYNLGGSHILSNPGTRNLFAGEDAGKNETNGGFNSYFGWSAGRENMFGCCNSFFGNEAGILTKGSHNNFFGSGAGSDNTDGYYNVFIGSSGGKKNTIGTLNTVIGHLADFGFSDLTNATAIGSFAQVDCSNCMVLGSIAGVSGGLSSVNVGIGTTMPTGPLHVVARSNSVASSPVISGATGVDNVMLVLSNTSTGGKKWFFDSTGGGSNYGQGNLAIGNGATFPGTPSMVISPTGQVGIGTGPAAAYMLNVNGKVLAFGFNGTCGPNSSTVVCNQDLAETFATNEQTRPGDVVSLSPHEHAKPTARQSLRAYDEHLLGVVSTNPGLVFDEGQTHLAGANDKLITKDKTVVAVVGRVPVRITTENGVIRVGDALTSSASVPGAAMKAVQAGKIIGYALESSAKAKEGKLLMWLQVGYYAPHAELGKVLAENAALKEQNQTIQQRNTELDARLTALEQALQHLLGQQGQAQTTKRPQ